VKQALIVIDVQESFRKRPYWRGDELPAFLKNVQSLIDQANARGIPIEQVFHEDITDDASDPFSRSSGLVRPMPELVLRPDAVFHKHVHSAMFGQTADGVTLQDWLRHRGIEESCVSDVTSVEEMILPELRLPGNKVDVFREGFIHLAPRKDEL